VIQLEKGNLFMNFENYTSENAVENPISGWFGLVFVLAAFAFGAAGVVKVAPVAELMGALMGISGLFLGTFLIKGLFVLQPNEAAALVLFGEYRVTLRHAGFFFVNPFYVRTKISLRVRNFNTPTMKVNDKVGNPVDVAAVVTWRVEETAHALFDVEDYQKFIEVQSELGLREMVSSHAYDGTDEELTLRGHFKETSRLLVETLQEYMSVAGIIIMEAKITHLAYSQEIASVMLRRQQAQAVVDAREKMVEGSIGMVRTAVNRLESENIVKLNDREKAALVTNLMTVLLSETGAQPVIQTSSPPN
jgi:regulator of protease activity HflC (stomatin/prohibitin superfamily)